MNKNKLYALLPLLFLLNNCTPEGENTNTGSRGGGSSDGKPNVIVIFTDDMGYADVGAQNQRVDVRTPNIDSIAANGARMTNGYVTAPQCTPSRAAMITGKYQEKFGLDDNSYGPMPLSVPTIGQHFQNLGYATGLVGKWHLDIDQNSRSYQNVKSIPIDTKKQYFPNHRGYTDTYFGYKNTFWNTFTMTGETKGESYTKNNAYRLDVVSDAAVSFIKKNAGQPFYLHVAHYAPHVPLEATPEYLEQFPGVTIQRRKYALAMISAVDKGVGRILNELRQQGILENTIIYFISDNGAPLGLDMSNTPINDVKEEWDGSMNTPLVGEKGMLTDGGIRVPFLVQWPGHINPGTIVDKPVISLDAVYTALKASGADGSVLGQMDGVDILPAMNGNSSYLNERPLFWRFWGQSAVRLGQWKYIRAGASREYLFDMSSINGENKNLKTEYPEKVDELKSILNDWERTLARGTTPTLNGKEKQWYNYFVK